MKCPQLKQLRALSPFHRLHLLPLKHRSKPPLWKSSPERTSSTASHCDINDATPVRRGAGHPLTEFLMPTITKLCIPHISPIASIPVSKCTIPSKQIVMSYIQHSPRLPPPLSSSSLWRYAFLFLCNIVDRFRFEYMWNHTTEKFWFLLIQFDSKGITANQFTTTRAHLLTPALVTDAAFRRRRLWQSPALKLDTIYALSVTGPL